MEAFCPICGWGEQVKPSCNTLEDVVLCDLNWENRRKYALRHKNGQHEKYAAVKSIRYQGVDGKGDNFERLCPMTIGDVQKVLARPSMPEATK